MTAFDLAPYIQSGWTTLLGGSHIFRIGNMGILQANASHSATLPSISENVYAGIPVAWRPSGVAYGPAVLESAFGFQECSVGMSSIINCNVNAVYANNNFSGCIRFKF